MAFTPKSSVSGCSHGKHGGEASKYEGHERGDATALSARTGTSRATPTRASCNEDTFATCDVNTSNLMSDSRCGTNKAEIGHPLTRRDSRRDYSARPNKKEEAASGNVFYDTTDSKGEPDPPSERRMAVKNNNKITPACWGRWRNDPNDNECQRLETVGDLLFSNPVLLWLLSPFLYLNELAKLRLLSKTVNRRWLCPRVLRWMMSNSVAMVFPAQWGEPVPQSRVACQEIIHQNAEVLQSSPNLIVQKARDTREHLEGEQQQDKEESHRDNNQGQQRRHLCQTRIYSGEEEQQARKEEQSSCTHQKQCCSWPPQSGDMEIFNSQKLPAEQQQPSSFREAETHLWYEHHSPNAAVIVNSDSTSLASPVALCGMSAAVAAGSAEASAILAKKPANVAASLSSMKNSSGDSIFFPSCSGNKRRLHPKSVSPEVWCAGQGFREGMKGGEFPEALSASREAQNAQTLPVRCPTCSCEPFHPFNILRSVLLRNPAAYGCGPLQLRQLTLHMPEDADAVVSLPQLQTYKKLLEICSPTLEELHLYDFSCFHAVIDISPAIGSEAGTGDSDIGAGEATIERKYLPPPIRKLKEALRRVELAHLSVFDPSEIFSPPAEGDIDEIEAEENAVADRPAGAASEGNSVLAGELQSGENSVSPGDAAVARDSSLDNETASAAKHFNAFLSAQKWKLTLSFKMWPHCQMAKEEDPVDEDERRVWGLMDEGKEFCDGYPLTSVENATNNSFTEPCRFYTINTYADVMPICSSPPYLSSCAVDSCATTRAPLALSNEAVTTIERSASDVSCSSGLLDAEAVSEPSPHPTDLPGSTGKREAAMPQAAPVPHECEGTFVSLPPASPRTATGEENGPTFKLANNSAAGIADNMTISRRRDSSRGRNGSVKFDAVSEIPRTSSVRSDSESGSLCYSRPFVSSGSTSDREFALNTAGRASCATAARQSGNPHQIKSSFDRGVQCEFYRIPTRLDVFQYLHENLSRLQLRCCFPRLKYLQAYGSAAWQSARPYYSCLACLFLPRDQDPQKFRARENSRAGNEDGSANNQAARRSSGSSQSSQNSPGNSTFDESCIDRETSTTHDQDRGTDKNDCSGTSRSQQNQSKTSRSRSGSRRAKNGSLRTSGIPERRRSGEQRGNTFNEGGTLRERECSTSFSSEGRVGKDSREITGGPLLDDRETAHDVKSGDAKADTAAAAKEGKAKAGLQQLAFPALQELYWLDASCIGEDLSTLLVTTGSKRLRKFSFSTYDASTVACVLRECVVHPWLFRFLQELVIDGLNFIWPEDEWWWFSGNSWFRFVEIWRLHAMGRNRLAPPYPAPHTLQQLQAQRFQREQQLCLARHRHTYISVYTEVNAEQLPENHSRPRHTACRGGEMVGSEDEEVCAEIRFSAPISRDTEEEREKESPDQARDTFQFGSNCHNNRSFKKEDTNDIGHQFAGGPTSHAEGLLGSNEGALTCRTQGENAVAEQREITTGWETMISSGSRRVHSKGSGNRCRSGVTMQERRRRAWRWPEDWTRPTDEEEENQSYEEVEALPAGFEGTGSVVDYEGIQRALGRLPRVRRLQFLNFVGQTLREPTDSTHTLGSFFPEADIEIQGSVFVGRRAFQRLLMKAYYKKYMQVRKCDERREQRSSRQAIGRDTSRKGKSFGSCELARSSGVKGIHRRRAGKERRNCSVRSRLSSESDDTFSGPLVEFAASPFRASTSQRISRSRSTSMVLAMPGTATRVNYPRDWRRFIRGAVQLSPLAEHRVSRWLRQGLIYKLHMKLAIDWTDRAVLRADGFHRECVAVYVSKVLECSPEGMRKGGAKKRQHQNLRILELTDCFHGSRAQWPEGHTNEQGYFVPFGHAKLVLEYFTPFLLGLDCFNEEVFIRSSTFDVDHENSSGESISVGVGGDAALEDGGASDSLLNGDRHGSGNVSEDATNVEAQRRLDEQSDGRSDRVTEEEPNRVLERRRTIQLDHDIAESVLVAGMSRQVGAAMQRFKFAENWSDANDGTEIGTRRGWMHINSEAESFPKDLESLPSIVRSAAQQATVEPGSTEREAGGRLKAVSRGGSQEDQGENVAGCGGLPGSVTEGLVDLQSLDGAVAGGFAAGEGYQAGCKQTTTYGVPKRSGGIPDESREILRLKGVAGLALPMYARFTDFRKQSSLVLKVACAYQAQTRVLVVTDSTLVFYRRCKEFYDNASAALARDFKAVTETCKDALQVLDYRLYRPYAWQCELGDSQDQTCMPSFIQTFLRNHPEFRLARRLDAIRPVENEVELCLEKVKTALTAYIWMKI